MPQEIFLKFVFFTILTRLNEKNKGELSQIDMIWCTGLSQHHAGITEPN